MALISGLIVQLLYSRQLQWPKSKHFLTKANFHKSWNVCISGQNCKIHPLKKAKNKIETIFRTKKSNYSNWTLSQNWWISGFLTLLNGLFRFCWLYYVMDKCKIQLNIFHYQVLASIFVTRVETCSSLQFCFFPITYSCPIKLMRCLIKNEHMYNL